MKKLYSIILIFFIIIGGCNNDKDINVRPEALAELLEVGEKIGTFNGDVGVVSNSQDMSEDCLSITIDGEQGENQVITVTYSNEGCDIVTPEGTFTLFGKNTHYGYSKIIDAIETNDKIEKMRESKWKRVWNPAGFIKDGRMEETFGTSYSESYITETVSISGDFVSASGNISTQDTVDIYIEEDNQTRSGQLKKRAKYSFEHTAEGSSTNDILEKQVSYTETGISYESQLLEKMKSSTSCLVDNRQLPTSGIEEIRLNGETYIVNYGDGSCDSIAEITISSSGEVYEIDLLNESLVMF